ncbi:MAG: FAD-dependent 5-carboxymethylaminomethyl-2-thiouridine(34) oxidoreductase MnmC [Proteobacteria bacterium]|nr:FAD-dependent 5-carboxymethylaminomethyl-2-thiouridine(34) oxidoreductase MnmC [Pseudomonadota bacterium]
MALKPAHLQWSDDGGLRSLDFDDIYFQPGQGPEESHYVFLKKNRLAERFQALQDDNFRIAELGFGSGLNFLLTAQLWRKTAPSSARLVYVSIEKHPVSSADLKKLYSCWPEFQEHAALLLDRDVSDLLPELTGHFDAWYLDGFSPAKNPAMWEEKLFPLLASRTKPGGTLSTFSSAGFVRRGLQQAGFIVEKITGFGAKRDMTVATMPAAARPQPPQIKNVTILGAGVTGATAAFALAQKGYQVTVLEQRQESAMDGSPGSPSGIVDPKFTVDASPAGSFHQHGFCFTLNLLKALKMSSWNPCGVVHLDISEETGARHRALINSGRWPEEFLRYEKTPSGMGIYAPLAGHLSPTEFCAILLQHPLIKAVYSTAVTSLDSLSGDAIIIALGNASNNFRETAWMPLQSLRGQITGIKENDLSRDIKTVICHEGYITPAVNGVHYIGATFQREAPATPEIRTEDDEENLVNLNMHLPTFGFSKREIVESHAGYRTTTPDKLPMIGACPDYEVFLELFAGLRNGKEGPATGKFIDKTFISTAVGSHGFTGAPLAGEIIASLVSGDPLPVPASLTKYLAPERYIFRDLKRGRI